MSEAPSRSWNVKTEFSPDNARADFVVEHLWNRLVRPALLDIDRHLSRIEERLDDLHETEENER